MLFRAPPCAYVDAEKGADAAVGASTVGYAVRERSAWARDWEPARVLNGAFTRPVRQALRKLLANGVLLAMLGATSVMSTACLAAADPAAPAPRVEARSADLLAVGVVHDDRMAIHLSRLADNAPVHDAVLTVVLRGVVHPTVAEADGSYTLQTKDLTLPGAAAVLFQVADGGALEEMKGALEVSAAGAKHEDKNSARQLGWWVLNFGVCIGFLMLLSRRRKAAARE